MTSPADAERKVQRWKVFGGDERAADAIVALEAELERLRQERAALLMVALRARDVWGSWGRVDSKLEALGHALAEPAAQELVTAALTQSRAGCAERGG